MTRIQKTFEKGPVFVGYLTGGDGGIDHSVNCALAMIEGGVNLLELGVPFSDPVADGPVIQAAVERSLSAGTTPLDIVEIGKRIREKSDIPLLLFTYYNPLFQGGKSLLKEVKEAGFDGILVVDLPLEEADEHIQLLAQYELDPIFIATPSTSQERLIKISASSKGFVYYACQRGTTGIRKDLPEDIVEGINRVKKEVKLPVTVGFGIADKENARKILELADGFVVGSLFVKHIAETKDPKKMVEVARSLDPR